jgi:hypothetical protein
VTEGKKNNVAFVHHWQFVFNNCDQTVSDFASLVCQTSFPVDEFSQASTIAHLIFFPEALFSTREHYGARRWCHHFVMNTFSMW